MNQCALSKSLLTYATDLDRLWQQANATFPRGKTLTELYTGSLDLTQLQQLTLAIDHLLRSVIAGQQLHPAYNEIISSGFADEPLYRETSREDRSAAEAYLHAYTMLEYAALGAQSISASCQLPEWSALLCLYNRD